jgi:hypothetical protein
MRMIAMWLSQHAYADEKYKQYAQRKLSAQFHQDENEMNMFIREFIDHILPYMDEITMGNADRFLSHDMLNHRMVLHMRFEKVLRELSVAERNQLFSLFYEIYDTMSIEQEHLSEDIRRYFGEEDMAKYRRQKEFMLTSVKVAGKAARRKAAKQSRRRQAAAAAGDDSGGLGGLMGQFASMMGGGAGGGGAAGMMGMIGNMLQNPQRLAQIGQSLEHSQLGQMAKQFIEEGKMGEILGQDGQDGPIDPAAMFQRIFSPDGQARMMGMMQSMAQQLDSKVQSGEINQDALQRDLFQVMQQAMTPAPEAAAAAPEDDVQADQVD